MAHSLNRLITRIFDILLTPFRFLGPAVEIVFLSILVSFVVLLVFKWVSSPRKIKKAKNQIKASILAIRLYKDFWKVILVSFARSLWYTLKYFTLNFGPILLIIPLLAPLFFQMEVRYGMRPYEVGESILLRAEFETPIRDLDIELLPQKEFERSMAPVFIDAFEDNDRTRRIREVNWSLTATTPGVSELQLRVGNRIFSKRLVVGETIGALSNRKMRDSSWAHFLYPVEELIDDNPDLRALATRYPPALVPVFGIRFHWLILHLILVVVIVLALRKRFGVEF